MWMLVQLQVTDHMSWQITCALNARQRTPCLTTSYILFAALGHILALHSLEVDLPLFFLSLAGPAPDGLYRTSSLSVRELCTLSMPKDNCTPERPVEGGEERCADDA
jgi:hypothetical protein